MATSAAHDKVNKKLHFSTTDVFGNEVICTAKAWNHVLEGHPEMAFLEHHVQAALSTPDEVKESTINTAAFAYEFTTAMAVDIRVVATYDEPHLLQDGQTIGKVLTSMPIDEVLYDKPNTGATVYVSTVSVSTSLEIAAASNEEEGGETE